MRLLNKTQMNFAYGMGAAIVIIGALMKITHFSFGFLTGNLMLTIGLVTEAIIFALSAFDPPGEDYAWEEVYPELSGGTKGSADKKSPKALMSDKIDEMFKKAKLLFKKCFFPTVYTPVPDEEERVSIITGETLNDQEELKQLEKELDLNSVEVNQGI